MYVDFDIFYFINSNACIDQHMQIYTISKIIIFLPFSTYKNYSLEVSYFFLDERRLSCQGNYVCSCFRTRYFVDTLSSCLSYERIQCLFQSMESLRFRLSNVVLTCRFLNCYSVTKLFIDFILSFSVDVLSFFSCDRHVAYILCAVKHNFRTFDRKTTNNFSKSYAKKLKN